MRMISSSILVDRLCRGYQQCYTQVLLCQASGHSVSYSSVHNPLWWPRSVPLSSRSCSHYRDEEQHGPVCPESRVTRWSGRTNSANTHEHMHYVHHRSRHVQDHAYDIYWSTSAIVVTGLYVPKNMYLRTSLHQYQWLKLITCIGLSASDWRSSMRSQRFWTA